jgi:ribonucleotide monophosphatase NagD (HAD superfamily)
MIGDRLDTDIFPAKQIGMRTIRILRGVSKIQTPLNENYRPEITIDTMNDIFQVL